MPCCEDCSKRFQSLLDVLLKCCRQKAGSECQSGDEVQPVSFTELSIKYRTGQEDDESSITSQSMSQLGHPSNTRKSFSNNSVPSTCDGVLPLPTDEQTSVTSRSDLCGSSKDPQSLDFDRDTNEVDCVLRSVTPDTWRSCESTTDSSVATSHFSTQVPDPLVIYKHAVDHNTAKIYWMPCMQKVMFYEMLMKEVILGNVDIAEHGKNSWVFTHIYLCKFEVKNLKSCTRC
ncbi:uncharacterized protein LOC142489331 isoform X5 [Ascaphus truei]|uniref:uncharacterized protein LOC142489331 isoform X5 n=1 Tax=Ascaphus truei TaxID=8439 RepID=UPI003F59909C